MSRFRLEARTLKWLAPRLFWISIVIGLALPWSLFRLTGTSASDFSLHFFTPGHSYFLIGIMNAAPFTAFGVASLILLGVTARQNRRAVIYARFFGVIFAGVCLIAISLHTHLSILKSSSSTAAIGYLFVWVVTFGALPVGYVVGWFFGTWLSRSGAAPAQLPLTHRLNPLPLLVGWLAAFIVGRMGTLLFWSAGVMMGGSSKSWRTLIGPPFIGRTDIFFFAGALIGGYIAAYPATSFRSAYPLSVGVLAALTQLYPLIRALGSLPVQGMWMAVLMPFLAIPIALLGGYMAHKESIAASSA